MNTIFVKCFGENILKLLIIRSQVKKVALELQEKVKARDSQLETLKLSNEQLLLKLSREQLSKEPKLPPKPSANDAFKHPGAVAINTPGTSERWHVIHTVARCFLFKPKIPIWANFGEPDDGKCCILCPLRIY
jgi:hypothetical protein